MTSQIGRHCAGLILIEAILGFWLGAWCLESDPSTSTRDGNSIHPSLNDNAGGVDRLYGKRSVYETVAGSCPGSCSCWFENPPPESSQHQVGIPGPKLHVDCSDLNLLDFPAPLANDTRVLNMSNNHLQNLTSLPPLPHLKILDLSFNWLRHLDNRWVFEYSPGLRVLRLSNNALRSLQHGSFYGLVHLESLDLSGNILRSLDTHALAGLHTLKTLRLDRNQLFHLSREWFMGLTSLTDLHLSHNHVSVLDPRILDRLAHLQHLDLSHNSLRLIDDQAFRGLANLKLLNLSGNTRLKAVPSKALAAVPNLDIFLMDSTTLSRLASFSFTGIRFAEVSISFCPRLRVLEKHSFYNMSRLLTLQIHDNPKLIFIHPSAFSLLPSLKHLILHNNGLIAVPAQIIQLVPSIADLHLHHNPFHCDCNSFWLRQELSKRHTTGSSSSNSQSLSQHRSNIDTSISNPRDIDNGTMSSNQNISTNQNAQSFNSDALPASSKSHSVTIDTTTPSSTSSSSIPSGHDHSHPNSIDNNSIYTSTPNPAVSSIHTTSMNTFRSRVREPDRVSCFFPDSLESHPSSLPMVQLPLAYFAPTCPATALPLFPTTLNVTLGEDMVLECQGLGIPTPRISWILPDGVEITSALQTQSSSTDNSAEALVAFPNHGTASRKPRIVDETFLRVPAVRLSDSGMYGCKASNSLGQDFRSVLVYVVNKPLELFGLKTGRDFITVSWRGAVRRTQMAEFQLYYRDMSVAPQHELQWNFEKEDGGADDVIDEDSDAENGFDLHNDYQTIRLHGSVHRCTITDLKPHTRYQVCLVYKSTHLVMCKEWTTLATGMPLVRASRGIVKVNLTQIVAAIAGVVGVLLVSVIAITLVRRRHRSEYQGPGAKEEKMNIPMEGLLPMTTQSPCLTSSRTALLSNSHV